MGMTTANTPTRKDGLPTILHELDILLAAQGKLQFAREDYDEAAATVFGVALLDFLRVHGMEVRRRLATPEQPGFRMTSDEGGWTKEDALRYIENWCPDYVKDYIVSLEQPGSSVQDALDYLHPYLDAGTFAAPNWAIDLASILTGGKRLSTPPAPAAEQDGYSLRMPEVVLLPATQPEARGVEGMARIGELIRTQDNRITDAPIFIVQQKRMHVSDPDYDNDAIVWVNDDNQEADEAEQVRLEAAFPEDGEPEGWRRLAVRHEWEFVTACFTEQGCKDYLARDGHNLKEPRIYAAGSYRNSEWRDVRNYLLALAAAPAAPGVRDTRQARVHDWCVAAFGDDHAQSLEQRGIRMAEEAIEAAQACGCDRDMLHSLVNYVYARPVGELRQELGGVGVTLLALAQAAGLSADDAEADEVARVLSKPLEHFAARNAAKNAAGFNVTPQEPT